jgi:hypothetical protein
MAARQFTRRARSVPVPKPAFTRSADSRARFLHVPAATGQAKPIRGLQAAMTLMQAAHVVTHAVLRGAFSIRWASPTRPSAAVAVVNEEGDCDAPPPTE